MNRNALRMGKQMKDLYIIGCGGFGREVTWLVNRINNINPTWNLLGFIDDNPSLIGDVYGEVEVVGDVEYLTNNLKDAYVICAIANSKIRKEIVKELGDVKYATLVDPSVILAESTIIKEGSIVCPGSVISVDCCIGSHVHINWNSTIGHDTVIKDFVTLYPSVNVSGNVYIQDCVEIGAGSQLNQGISIGINSIIGSGSVIIRNVKKDVTVVGVPGREI